MLPQKPGMSLGVGLLSEIRHQYLPAQEPDSWLLRKSREKVRSAAARAGVADRISLVRTFGA